MSNPRQVDIQSEINEKHLMLDAADQIVAQAYSVYEMRLSDPRQSVNRTRWVMHTLGYLRGLKAAANAFQRPDIAEELSRREADLFNGFDALKRAHEAQTQQTERGNNHAV